MKSDKAQLEIVGMRERGGQDHPLADEGIVQLPDYRWEKTVPESTVKALTERLKMSACQNF